MPERTYTDQELVEMLLRCLDPMKRQTPEYWMHAMKLAGERIRDYAEVRVDQQRLVREMDVAMNGTGAAKQASLCDLVAQVEAMAKKLAHFTSLMQGGPVVSYENLAYLIAECVSVAAVLHAKGWKDESYKYEAAASALNHYRRLILPAAQAAELDKVATVESPKSTTHNQD